MGIVREIQYRSRLRRRLQETQNAGPPQRRCSHSSARFSGRRVSESAGPPLRANYDAACGSSRRLELA